MNLLDEILYKFGIVTRDKARQVSKEAFDRLEEELCNRFGPELELLIDFSMEMAKAVSIKYEDPENLKYYEEIMIILTHEVYSRRLMSEFLAIMCRTSKSLATHMSISGAMKYACERAAKLIMLQRAKAAGLDYKDIHHLIDRCDGLLHDNMEKLADRLSKLNSKRERPTGGSGNTTYMKM